MLVEIRDLKVRYKQGNELVEVVRGVDLEIRKGECVGLVGESGCGKTTVGLSITRLLPAPLTSISGEVLFQGQDIMIMSGEELREIRGRKVSYVFQEPFSSLNPVFTIYQQLKEALPEDTGRGGKGRVSSISEMLKRVGLSEIADKKNVYPHELSGGMLQRVMIAMAIAPGPELLILDEPTTALDVTVQKQILDLIMDLKTTMGLSILFISHDLRIIFRVADKVNVMYAGRIMEELQKDKITEQAVHPYTIGLINSIPSFGHRKKYFNAIEGRAPIFTDLPAGCKFHPRCKFRITECLQKEPDMDILQPGHLSRCIRARELLSSGTFKDR